MCVSSTPSAEASVGGRLRWISRQQVLALLRCLGDERLEPRHLGFGGRHVPHVRRKLLDGQLDAGFLRSILSVSEALGESIDRLSRPIEIEAEASFIERAL